MVWAVWELDHTEQNPHLVNTAVSPDRVKFVLFVQSPDRLNLFADIGSAEFLDRLLDILVAKERPELCYGGNIHWVIISLPCGDHDYIGFDFASVVEKRTSLVESLEFWATLDLDLTVDDHGAGADI